MDILFLDDWLVAVNKPSGLLVHRSLIDKHETDFVLQRVRNQLGRRVYPVHRLDKPTSGILMLALDPGTARAMTARFIAGQVEKTYRAIVRGFPEPVGVIDYALREEFDPLADARADRDKDSQAAVTQYRRLATVELPHGVGRYPTARYALVELQPKTGRKHQLRRHTSSISSIPSSAIRPMATAAITGSFTSASTTGACCWPRRRCDSVIPKPRRRWF